jgi:hypothetical protein
MSQMLKAVILASSFLLVPFANEALACSCISNGGPPCQAVFATDVIFAGTVRSIESFELVGGEFPITRKRVTFGVIERYRNVAEVGTLDVSTGAGGGDCGVGFTVGERYLVYASRRESGELTVSICSRTNLLADAAEDVEFLRSMSAKGSGGRVFGRVIEVRPSSAGLRSDYIALEGIPVTIQSADFRRDVLSDANGKFEVRGVPLGKAKVEVSAPFGYDTRHLSRDIEIPDLRACSSVEWFLSMRAVASGRVVDAADRPLARITIEVVSAELPSADPLLYTATSDERGMFTFDDLPPGRYLFGVNLTKSVRRTPQGPSAFLPGVATASDAKVIELTAGDEVDVGVLRLPPR